MEKPKYLVPKSTLIAAAMISAYLLNFTFLDLSNDTASN